MNYPKQNLPANNLKNKVFKTYPQNRDTLNIKIFLYFKFQLYSNHYPAKAFL